MSATRITRRRFLTAAGVALGATTVTLSGLSGLGADEPSVVLPRMILGGDTMTNRILVAYASRAGSTASVAEAIGQTLAASGLPVEVRAMTDVADLAPYSAVVAGSAIRGGKWLPEAMQFLQAHRRELSRVPFAAFLVCITMGSPNPKYREGVTTWMAPVRALVRPVSEGFFAGVLDFGKLPLNKDTLMLRAATALGALPQGDHRDWEAIRAWASTLAKDL